jgi:nucleotide-binding universal stress UspA family protein
MDSPMIKRVLISIGDNGLNENVTRYAARVFPLAQFFVISVVNTYERGISLTDLLYKELSSTAKKEIEKATQILHEEKITNVTATVLEGLPGKAVVGYAKKNNIDLILLYIDSKKAQASYYKMGSTTREIIKNCQTPVMTVTTEVNKIPIKKVLFTTDGKKKSQRAKNFSLLFSSSYKATLEVLHVFHQNENDKHAMNILNDIEWKASFVHVEVKKSLEQGNVIENILAHAQNNDVVIMGIERKILLWHILGRITQTVVTKPSVPVILVHYFKEKRSGK